MRRILLLGLAPWLLAAQSHWVQFRSGPFELYTEAGAKRGREMLGWFDQSRYVLGYMLGNSDLQTARPVRILLLKNAKERGAYPATPALINGRDRWVILLNAEAPIPHEVFSECARLLLENNAGRMPAAIEHGLAGVLSTIQVNGTHVTLGSPLPPGERNRDWARMQLFATNADYYAKLRIFLYNLQKGVDEDPAYLNAFGKSRAEMEKELDRHMAAGDFAAAPVDGKALSVERDYHEQPLLAKEVRLALADLMLGEESRNAYADMIRENENVASAHEGLAMMALRDGRKEDARQNFESAIATGKPSPQSYLEYAKLEPDNTKALAALEKALKLNPRLAETYALIGKRQTDPSKRLQYKKKASELSPRDAARWQQLAEELLAQKDFAEAAKAWRNAEQAATTPEERARMAAARLAIDQQRLDWEESERQRVAEENAREIHKLKDQAIAELRAAEAKANQGKGATPEKVERWWEEPKPAGHAAGSLLRVECLGRQMRLVLEDDDHKLTKLLIADPSSVTIVGSGDEKLTCGAQKPRPVVVDYFPKRNAKAATVGEVATIQFP